MIPVDVFMEITTKYGFIPNTGLDRLNYQNREEVRKERTRVMKRLSIEELEVEYQNEVKRRLRKTK